MATLNAPPHPPSVNMGGQRPHDAAAAKFAGKALFSSFLGRTNPRPVSDPPDPVIARGSNQRVEISHQIASLAQHLQDTFPTECKDLFPTSYTVHDYFDPRDIHRLGIKFLCSVLYRIADQNRKACRNFTIDWASNNPEKVEKIARGTSLREIFTDEEIASRGEVFFTIAVTNIRDALHSTAAKQKLRKEKRTHLAEELAAETSMQQGRTTRSDPTHSSQSQIGKAVNAGLYRVGWREPSHQQHASTSAPATPPHRAPKPGPPSNMARMPSYLANVPAIMGPPPHYRDHGMPYIGEMAPGGFPPQDATRPGPYLPMQAPAPQAVTAQGGPTHMHLPARLDPIARHKDHNWLPNFANPPGMHPIHPPEMPLNQAYSCQMPPYMPSHMPAVPAGGHGRLCGYPAMSGNIMAPPMSLHNGSSMSTTQNGVHPENMGKHRMSAPGARRDLVPRPPNKQLGKGSRGNRRNSARGNHHGADRGAPLMEHLGMYGGNGAPPVLPLADTEQFPPFRPPFDVSPGMATDRRPRPCVWVYNLEKKLGIEGVSRDLRQHFEKRLGKRVLEVRVSHDKNNDLYAHVNLLNMQDVHHALKEEGSIFHGRRLMVRIPMKQQRLLATLQHQAPFMIHSLPQGGHALPPPLHFSQAPLSQPIAPYMPHGPTAPGVPEDKRRSPAATRTRRSRGASRTYEATAGNPMSYSPQDARRMQPVDQQFPDKSVPPKPASPATEASNQQPGTFASSATSRQTMISQSTSARSSWSNHTTALENPASQGVELHKVAYREAGQIGENCLPDRPLWIGFAGTGSVAAADQVGALTCATGNAEEKIHPAFSKANGGNRPLRQRPTQITVPDDTLHGRCGSQATPSAVSSSCVNPAHAVALNEPPVDQPSSTVLASKSPASEQDAEGSFFTPPTELPPSPPTKSTIPLAAEEAPNGYEGLPPTTTAVQAQSTMTQANGCASTPTGTSALTSADAPPSHAELASTTATQPNSGEGGAAAPKSKADGPRLPPPPPSPPQDSSGSIHPYARSRTDKKKPPKKTKAQGKGKKSSMQKG